MKSKARKTNWNGRGGFRDEERERGREQLEVEGQGNNARLVDVGVSY